MPSARAKVGVAGAPLLRMRGHCGSNIWTAVMIVKKILTCLIFSDQIFRKEKGERFLLMMDHHVLKTCGKCDNAFDEESDEASCAVPCIECDKRF